MDKHSNIKVPGVDEITSRFSCSDIEAEFLRQQMLAGWKAGTAKLWCRDFSTFKNWMDHHADGLQLDSVSLDVIPTYREWLNGTTDKSQNAIQRYIRSVTNFVTWKDRLDDLTGSKFGEIVVLGPDESAKRGGGLHAKWVCLCNKCGAIKSMRGSDLRTKDIIDCGCTKDIRAGNKLAKADIMINSHFGHLTVLRRDHTKETGCGVHAFWVCRCDLCGREESIAAHRLRGSFEVKDRCSYCVKKSLGEAKIRELLDNAQISYKTERTFDGCVNPSTNYKLRFDFDIAATETSPEYLIEFDGEQHFHAAPMWDDTDNLSGRQMKDQIKTDWCAQNDIPLIRIPYTHLRQLCLADLILNQSQFVVTPQSSS